MDYSIQPLTKDNLFDLQTLYKSVFGLRVSRKFVEGKFDTTYLGLSYFGHLAYYRDKPIAFHGAIPVLMRYMNKCELAAQYGDAMTLPDHMGRGLFTKLGKLTDEKLIKAGITFVWGFPNQNSEYGYMKKLEWRHQERMLGFRIKASKIPILKIAEKLDNKIGRFYHRKLDKEFERFRICRNISGSVFTHSGVVSVYRNDSYYKYKEFGKSFMIEIDGVAFWIKVRGGLLVGDIEIGILENFDTALNKLKEIARRNGISELIIQASPHTLIESLLKDRADETFRSWAVGYKNFSSKFPLERLKFTLGDLDTF